jgi:hypothetical protein
MPSYQKQKQIHLENLAITLKYILSCGRTDFKVKNLVVKTQLEGRILGNNVRSLVTNGYLIVKHRNPPRYYVKDWDSLRAYYEDVKRKLDRKFIELVLEES